MHRPKGAFRLYSSDPAEIICTDTELLYDSKRRGESIQRIPLTDVVSVEVEDGEAAQARVTATRLVALGIFALAAKKKSGGDKWLMIATRSALLTLRADALRCAHARRSEGCAVPAHARSTARSYPLVWCASPARAEAGRLGPHIPLDLVAL